LNSEHELKKIGGWDFARLESYGWLKEDQAKGAQMGKNGV